MSEMWTMQGKREQALARVGYEEARALLENDPQWGASVLRLAGENARQERWVRQISRGRKGSRVLGRSGAGSFIAWGVVGARSFVAYRVESGEDGWVRVTPLAYLPVGRKVSIALMLALFYVLPVFLSPLVWRKQALQVQRTSRKYLAAFCRCLLGEN